MKKHLEVQRSIEKTQEISLEMQIQNNIEIARQIQQLHTAHRKLANYKEKLKVTSTSLKQSASEVE